MGRSRQLRRGFTLTELAMVMAIIGSITGAIWWAAGNTREAAKENDAVAELQNVSQNMINLMQGQNFQTPFGNITSTMITSQVIPSSYINIKVPTTVDNPWSSGGFTLTSLTAKTYRIQFVNPTRKGCVALLLQGTACQSGQTACPTEVYTSNTSKTCQPNQAGCTGTVPATGIGWQVMNSINANAMCAANTYTSTGTTNVSFDFSL